LAAKVKDVRKWSHGNKRAVTWTPGHVRTMNLNVILNLGVKKKIFGVLQNTYKLKNYTQTFHSLIYKTSRT
jgi:hypothetical protein